MVKVYFIKAGTPYGYGYTAGEFGLINDADLKDTKKPDGKGGEVTIKGLASLGVVRVATEQEYNEAIAGLQAKTDEKKPKGKKTGGVTAKTAGPLIQGGSDPADPADPTE